MGALAPSPEPLVPGPASEGPACGCDLATWRPFANRYAAGVRRTDIRLAAPVPCCSAAFSREPQQREGPVGSSVGGRRREVVPATPLPTAGPRPARGCAEERRADSSASRRKPHPARRLGALGLTPCTPGVSASGPLLASPKTEPSARQPGTSRPDSPVFLQPPWSEMHSVQRRQTCPSPKAFPNLTGGAGGPRTATVLTMTSSPAETQPSLRGLTALQPVARWLCPPDAPGLSFPGPLHLPFRQPGMPPL